MSGAAVGLVTALALAGSQPHAPSLEPQDLQLGARRSVQAPRPLFGAGPRQFGGPAAVPEAHAGCRTPVVVADNGVDPRFVVRVPEGPGVPEFTMRRIPPTPCAPAWTHEGGTRRPRPQREQ